MTEVQQALVIRCPELSDGARITLQEILLHYQHGRVIPSLTKLASLRNVWKSTIQEHMGELKERKILLVFETSDGARQVTIDFERLAKLNGFASLDQVKLSWIKSTDVGVAKALPENELTLNKPVAEYRLSDFVFYFKLAGKRHKADFVETKTSLLGMVSVIRKYGKGMTVKLIDHFAMQHKHMKVPYSLDVFVANAPRILGKVIA